MFAFNETATGHNHIIKNTECEDFSDSISNERYYIAIVADGHGAKECFRSGLGAKFAVEITKQCLKDFAESIIISPKEKITNKTVFITPRPFSEELLCDSEYYRNQEIKRLTDTIIYRWHDEVKNHYEQYPPTKEELKDNKVEDMDINNLSEDEKFHIYGTTLIAGLMLSKCLILIQQGDGRCEVFIESDKGLQIRQPIPWDSRCEYNVTTSMCDEDVVESIRSRFINLTKKKVIACYLGSDGVEDAYRDTYEDLGGSHKKMGGVDTFYKHLSYKIVKKGEIEFKQSLKKNLPDFSKNGLFSRTGSGDDVSIAGIVDVEALSKYVSQFKDDINIYKLDEELFWKGDELRGKLRKHGILKQNYLDSETAYEKAEDEYNRFVDAWEKRNRFGKPKNLEEEYWLRQRGRNLKQKCKEAAEQCLKDNKLFNDYDQTFNKIQDEIELLKQKKSDPDRNSYNSIADKNKIYNEEIQQELYETIEKLDNEIKDLDGQLERLEKDIEEERRRSEEEARRRAEEEARRKAEEEARRKAEKEARRKAEEERRKAEEERRRAEAEARRKAGQTTEDNKVFGFMSTINGLINGAVEKGGQYIEQGGKYIDNVLKFGPLGNLYISPDQMDSSVQMGSSEGEEQSRFGDSKAIEYETESSIKNTEEDKSDKQENQSDDSNDDLAGKDTPVVDESEENVPEPKQELTKQVDSTANLDNGTIPSGGVTESKESNPDPETSANVDPDSANVDSDSANVDQGTPANDDTGTPANDDPDSANVDQGTPANVASETPVNADQVTSANVASETPANADTETPVNVDQGTPVNADTETPVNVDQGTHVNADTETPVNVDQGTPVNADTETPANVATETPVNDDQVTSANDDTETPVNVDQGTPVKADTETPANVDQGTPVNADTETPANADTETPVNADQVTSANVDSETPANADTETPANADTETPANADTETPANADTETPANADTETPVNVDQGTPANADTETPVNADQGTSANVAPKTPANDDTETPANVAPETAANVATDSAKETDSKESETDETTTSEGGEQPQGGSQVLSDDSSNDSAGNNTPTVDESKENVTEETTLEVIEPVDLTDNLDDIVIIPNTGVTDSEESGTNETTTSESEEQPQGDQQQTLIEDFSNNSVVKETTQPVNEPKENVTEPKQEEKEFADPVDSAEVEIPPDKAEEDARKNAKKEVRNEDGSIPIEVKHTTKSNNKGETTRVVNSHYSERRISKEKYSCSVSRKFKVQLEIYPNPEFEEDDDIDDLYD